MKFGMLSLGCPTNLVDSEVMLGLAREAGHELTDDASDADVLVVNTCAFIDSAKQESVDAILDMAQLKKDRAGRRLIVTGCLAERYRDDLKREVPEIDVVLGTGEVPAIVGAIERATDAKSASSAVPLPFHRSTLRMPASTLPVPSSTPRVPSSTLRVPSSTLQTPPSTQAPPLRVPPTFLYDANTPRVLATPRHFAYVKIAEGCDYKCAFCIIPTLRGHYRSRAADSIVSEARALAARGVRELLLISQDTTFYGIDRGERGALPRLLRQLNTVDGIEWIRLLYLYPTTIDEATLGAMADGDRICKYVDLPLQHASNAVLKRMKRPGTQESYRRLLDRIRRTMPGVTLRTTFIVGFPGETEDDVDQLCDFVAETAFDHVGVFTYSHEEGTSAFAHRDDVPAEVKEARRARVMALQKRLVSEAQRHRIGTRTRVVIDGTSDEHELVVRARSAAQAPDIDPCVYLTECDPSAYRPGDFAEVEIVDSRDYDLIATPL